jgi:hypothetical protein
MLAQFTPGYNPVGVGFDLPQVPMLEVQSPHIWSFRGLWPFLGLTSPFFVAQANSQAISAPSPVVSPQLRIENPLPWWQNKKDV